MREPRGERGDIAAGRVVHNQSHMWPALANRIRWDQRNLMVMTVRMVVMVVVLVFIVIRNVLYGDVKDWRDHELG